MTKKCSIFLCVTFIIAGLNIQSHADNKCASEIVVKNPRDTNRFGAKLKPPKGSDYSVWFPVVPRSLIIDSKGDLYIGDSINYRVLKFNKQGKFLLQFIIQDIGVDGSDNIYAWNYFEDRVEIFTSKGQFVRFADPREEIIKHLYKKEPTGRLAGYKYEIDSYAPDKRRPGKLLYRISVMDKNMTTISECNGVDIAYDDEGLIYAIGQDGYIYTFDYYKTLDVIKINPFSKVK